MIESNRSLGVNPLSASPILAGNPTNQNGWTQLLDVRTSAHLDSYTIIRTNADLSMSTEYRTIISMDQLAPFRSFIYQTNILQKGYFFS